MNVSTFRTLSKVLLPVTVLLSLAAADVTADIKTVTPMPMAGATLYNAAKVSGSPLSIDLADYDYVEEEFFISGVANAYSYSDAQLTLFKKNVPYTTRIVIRRPSDPKKFSGVLHVEAEHPSQGGTSHWLTINNYLVNEGDAYVSIGIGNDPRQRQLTAQGEYPTSQSEVIKWFNPERYSALSWPEEDGIRYEVFGNVLQLLRSNQRDNPLRNLQPQTVIAGGWSFTGSFLRTYINYGFHERLRKKNKQRLIDGYLVGISSRWNSMGVLPLNISVASAAMTDPVRELKVIDAPVIEFLTEFEVAAGDGPQRADSDAKAGAHRLYELGAAIHSDQQLLDRGGNKLNRTNIVQLEKKGYPVREIRGEDPSALCSMPISDVPQGPLARAVVDNLKQWVKQGTPPPHASELRLTPEGKVMRDHHDNAMGGFPLAEFALPIASYHEVDKNSAGCEVSGGRPLMVRENFSAPVLKDLYQSKAAYLNRYGAYIDSMVAERWLLKEDAALVKARMEKIAAEAFSEK